MSYHKEVEAMMRGTWLGISAELGEEFVFDDAKRQKADIYAPVNLSFKSCGETYHGTLTGDELTYDEACRQMYVWMRSVADKKHERLRNSVPVKLSVLKKDMDLWFDGAWVRLSGQSATNLHYSTSLGAPDQRFVSFESNGVKYSGDIVVGDCAPAEAIQKWLTTLVK